MPNPTTPAQPTLHTRSVFATELRHLGLDQVSVHFDKLGIEFEAEALQPAHHDGTPCVTVCTGDASTGLTRFYTDPQTLQCEIAALNEALTELVRLRAEREAKREKAA